MALTLPSSPVLVTVVLQQRVCNANRGVRSRLAVVAPVEQGITAPSKVKQGRGTCGIAGKAKRAPGQGAGLYPVATGQQKVSLQALHSGHWPLELPAGCWQGTRRNTALGQARQSGRMTAKCRTALPAREPSSSSRTPGINQPPAPLRRPCIPAAGFDNLEQQQPAAAGVVLACMVNNGSPAPA